MLSPAKKTKFTSTQEFWKGLERIDPYLPETIPGDASGAKSDEGPSPLKVKTTGTD